MRRDVDDDLFVIVFVFAKYRSGRFRGYGVENNWGGFRIDVETCEFLLDRNGLLRRFRAMSRRSRVHLGL